MGRFSWSRKPLGLILSTLFIVTLAAGCVLGPEEGSRLGETSIPDDGTAQGTTTRTEHVEGIVKRIDVEAGLLTLVTASGDSQVVSVDQSTAISFNGSSGTLEDLEPGDPVQLEVDRSTDIASSIVGVDNEEATGPPRRGTVANVDPGAGLLILTTVDGESKVVSVEQSTVITVNGSTGDLEDLQPGDPVEVEVREGTDVATAVTVEDGEEPEESPGPPARKRLKGTVESVAPDAGQATVAVSGSDVVTVSVGQSTAITIDGSTGDLEDVRPGDPVEVQIDQYNNVATSLSVDRSQASAVGEIAGVDPASQTVTVETRDDRVLQLRFLGLDGSTQALIEGGEGSLVDLARGTTVEIIYNPDTMVVITLRVRSDGSGGPGTPGSP